MSTQQSIRTYSYHFTKLNERSERIFTLNSDNHDPSKYQGKLNFRYFADCKQQDKRNGSPQLELPKHAALPERASQPVKKYTFSMLAQEQKQLRKSEDKDPIKAFPHSYKYTTNLNKTIQSQLDLKPVYENGQELSQQKTEKSESTIQSIIQSQVVTLKRNNQILAQKLEALEGQNQLLRVRTDEYKKRCIEYENNNNQLNQALKLTENKISTLEFTLTNLTKQNEQIKKQANQSRQVLSEYLKLRQRITISSKVIDISLQIESPEKSCKITKQESLQTISSFEEEYQEIIALVGIQANAMNRHKQLIKQIKKIKKSLQLSNTQKILLGEMDKERCRLLHHLKKNEAELARMCVLNSFLNNQLAKSCSLVQDYNEEISKLYLQKIQAKLCSKVEEE